MKANQDSSSALVSAVNQFSTSAAADRISSAQSMSKLASAVARGGDAPRSRDQFAKGDTISTILKVEKDCHNWAKATPFEPTKHCRLPRELERLESALVIPPGSGRVGTRNVWCQEPKHALRSAGRRSVSSLMKGGIPGTREYNQCSRVH